MKTVTRTELAEAAYINGGVTRNDARSLVDQCLEMISDALVAGDKVVISGFGSFNVRQKSDRIGRNPREPRETHVITARRVVVFRASPLLKGKVADDMSGHSSRCLGLRST